MGLLKNFRRGFATNSSSSHSFVYLKRPAAGAEGIGDNEFGWGDFRLDSVKEKLFYVLVSRIGGSWKKPSAQEAMEIHGKDFPEFEESDFRYALEGYVDHESVGILDLDKARDPYVVVFGGNDNGDGSQERMSAFDEIDWIATEPSREEYGRMDDVKKARNEQLRAASKAVSDPAPKPAPKYHLAKDGNVRACRARTRPCPYASDDHFTSRGEAEEALAKRHG